MRPWLAVAAILLVLVASAPATALSPSETATPADQAPASGDDVRPPAPGPAPAWTGTLAAFNSDEYWKAASANRNVRVHTNPRGDREGDIGSSKLGLVPTLSNGICGDQNNDSQVNVFDVIIDLQIIVGLVQPTPEQQRLSDVVRDENIDIFDVILTLQHIVGLTTITECGPTSVPSRNFSLEVTPAEGTVIQGNSTPYAVSASGTEGFSDLITLGVTGLPAGVTGSFSPKIITAGQRSTFTISAATDAQLTSVSITITGQALISGSQVTRTAAADLTVEAAGQTALLGQVMLVDGTPLEGVRLTLNGQTRSTDGGGNFQFLDVPAGEQTMTVDATPANPAYPIYGVDVVLIEGQATRLAPLQITPPPPPEQFVPIDNATEDQVVTDARFPGVSITLPAGATITGWDGSPKDMIAVEQLMPDQLPVPPPPGAVRSLYQFHFGSPMGGIPSAPLPVTLPNDLDLSPGDKAEIWYYDAAPFPGVDAGWVMAGLGTVSEDGTTIVADPGVGIQRFCGVCGVVGCSPSGPGGPPPFNPDGPGGGDPVNLAMGHMIVDEADLELPGRLPFTLSRTYNPFHPFASLQLGLGLGWSLSVDVALIEASTSLRRIVLPGNARFEFARNAQGEFVNTKHPRFAGAVLTADGGGAHTLRFPDGTTWRFAGAAVAGFGLLVEQADRNGNRVRIERDGQGTIQRIVDSADRTLNFAYSGARIREIKDPLGRTVSYTYNAGSRLEAVTNPDGGVTRYTYDSEGKILTITDPRGIVSIRNEYSAASDRLLTQELANGGVWRFRYQLQGARVTGPGCPGPACPTEETTERVAQGYAFNGGIVTATTQIDPEGNPTTYRFTPDRFASEQTDALGQTTRFQRDARGLLVSTTDPLGRVTQYTYDAKGNVTSIIDPALNVTAFTYEPNFSQVTGITDPLGNLTTFEYDAFGNLIAITDPEQSLRPVAERLKTRIEYNQFGQPTRITDLLSNVTSYSYNAQGDLQAVTDPLGNTSNRSYDAISRLVRKTNPLGGVTRITYDLLSRFAAIAEPLGETTAATYDPNSNLVTVTDAGGNTTTYQYDQMNQVNRRTDPLGEAETFSYDLASNLVETVDRKDQRTTYAYDELNRLVRLDFADGSIVTFTYDAVGRLLEVNDTADPHRPIVIEYDILDRPLAETTAKGTVRYAYDALGRRTQMTVNGQSPVAYTYDANSRLQSISQNPLSPVNIQYDALGRRTLLGLPNGVSTQYQYDAACRLTMITFSNTSGPLGSLTYQYDPVGRRIAVGNSFSATTLLSDPVSSATYDAANRLGTFGNIDASYDDNGNLTSLVDPSGTTTFTWDARNRLISIAGAGAPSSFAYDGLDRRVRKTSSGTTTDFQYDAYDIIAEIEGGSTAASYLRGRTIDEIFARRSAANEYYHTDALGTVLALSRDGGNIQTSYAYEPFGRTVAAGAASENLFQFTARENDGTGLYYYRARYYSPTMQRFISEDPAGLFSGDLNYYAYVFNNPVMFNDPHGLAPGLACQNVCDYNCRRDKLAGFGCDRSCYQRCQDQIDCVPRPPGGRPGILYILKEATRPLRCK